MQLKRKVNSKMGTVMKRRNRWTIRYSLPPGPDGKRRQKWESCGPSATKKDAEALLYRRMLDVDAGLNIDLARRPLRDVLSAWMESPSTRVEIATETRRRDLIGSYVLPRLGHVRVELLHPFTLVTWFTELRKEGVDATELVALHQLLSEALDWCLMRGGLERNPMHAVDPPKAGAVVQVIQGADPLDSAISESRVAHERAARRA